MKNWYHSRCAAIIQWDVVVEHDFFWFLWPLSGITSPAAKFNGNSFKSVFFSFFFSSVLSFVLNKVHCCTTTESIVIFISARTRNIFGKYNGNFEQEHVQQVGTWTAWLINVFALPLNAEWQSPAFVFITYISLRVCELEKCNVIGEWEWCKRLHTNNVVHD